MSEEKSDNRAPVHAFVMPRSSAAQRKLLESYHFRQGEVGNGPEITCEDCDKACSGQRGWWQRTSYEYNEWDCKCRACALAYCERYETFDVDEYQQIAESA